MRFNNYDFIAPVYDPLSTLFLGRAYHKSKHSFLEYIKPDMNIWCLGGGTGEIIPPILSRNAPDGKLVFSEASKKMLELAGRRVISNNLKRVVFHHNDAFEWPLEPKADMIICHFFLDVLTDLQLDSLFSNLNQITQPAAHLLFVDFYPVPSRDFFLYTMIYTFGWVTGHPRKELPDYEYFFNKYGWATDEEKCFQKGFIKAKCLVKKV